MASYKDRLTRDLDQWIARGLVPTSSRTGILAGVETRATADAPTELVYTASACWAWR